MELLSPALEYINFTHEPHGLPSMICRALCTWGLGYTSYQKMSSCQVAVFGTLRSRHLRMNRVLLVSCRTISAAS